VRPCRRRRWRRAPRSSLIPHGFSCFGRSSSSSRLEYSRALQLEQGEDRRASSGGGRPWTVPQVAATAAARSVQLRHTELRAQLRSGRRRVASVDDLTARERAAVDAPPHRTWNEKACILFPPFQIIEFACFHTDLLVLFIQMARSCSDRSNSDNSS
jgi:hypothetical protein